MKFFSSLLFIFILTINSNNSFAEDALTVKQQLDRIMEEIKDLNKAVFNKSFDNKNLNSLDESIDSERFTSIDIRIYDLEKDIKNLSHKEKNYIKILKLFLNTKYVWGGKTFKGIDCSALLQMFYYYNQSFYPRDTIDQIKFSKKKVNWKLTHAWICNFA